MKLIISCFFTFAFLATSYGQTCCSSGIPIASNLGFQSKGKKVIQFSLGFDHNRLSSLYAESQKLDDNNRLRITNTYLGRISYGFTDFFQLELLIPVVSQFRQIKQNNGEFNQEGGFGLGDITLMSQVDLLKMDFVNFNLGLGIKLPTGANDIRNDAGFLLINDLQLGSNSLDYLVRTAIHFSPEMRPSSSIFANGTYVIKGRNEEYLGSELYKFGNEIQVIMGYSDQLFLWNKLFFPSVSLRLRQASNDMINTNNLDNTGGQWVFGKIGLGFEVFQSNLINFNFEYPLYTKVKGTQLSPDYIFNFSFYKQIDLNPIQ